MILLLYYVFINLFLFAKMGVDKYKAVHHKWRIPEASLYVTAFLGGALGGFLGMFVFRHKIRKPKFYFMFTLALLIHLFLIHNYISLFASVSLFVNH
ncbi:MAG: DUF1294 domain-containing protein [Clostridiales bacterium]|nr:DUF1294 domain-containing protein [Clostridiales bacterium]